MIGAEAMQSPPGAGAVIARAAGAEDFGQAWDLLREMAVWDAAETRARGFDGDELLRLCYSETTADLRQTYSAPGAALLIARRAGEVVGCCSFRDSEEGIAEVTKFFVRPNLRGAGVGRALFCAVLAEATESGYTRIRLETAGFMTQALALYRRSGFSDCPPFRPPMGDLGPDTIFMERPLPKAK